MNLAQLGVNANEVGLINQHGLSRKVGTRSMQASLGRRINTDYSTFLIQSRQVWNDYSSIISMCCNVRDRGSSIEHPYWHFLCQGHRFDTDTPIEELVGRLSFVALLKRQHWWQSQMHALHDVVQAGHVRYIGMSSCRAYQCKFEVVTGLIYADRRIPDSSCYAKYGLIIPLLNELTLATRLCHHK